MPLLSLGFPISFLSCERASPLQSPRRTSRAACRHFCCGLDLATLLAVTDELQAPGVCPARARRRLLTIIHDMQARFQHVLVPRTAASTLYPSLQPRSPDPSPTVQSIIIAWSMTVQRFWKARLPLTPYVVVPLRGRCEAPTAPISRYTGRCSFRNAEKRNALMRCSSPLQDWLRVRAHSSQASAFDPRFVLPQSCAVSMSPRHHHVPSSTPNLSTFQKPALTHPPSG